MARLQSELSKEQWENGTRPVLKVSWADAKDGDDKDTISGRHSRAATISASDAQRILNVVDDSKVVRDFLGSKNDLSEVYSPPRVTEEASKSGMVAGFSLDLTVPDSEGRLWDFSERSCRQKADDDEG